MRDIKIFIVYHKSHHHASFSGYAQFVRYMTNVELILPKPILPYFFSKRIAQFLGRNIGNYDTSSFLKDIQVIIKILKNWNKNIVVHYLNGERDIRLAIYLFSKRKNIKFIATFHKPPEILNTLIVNKKYIQKLDGAVVVGVNQLEYMRNTLENTSCIYIQHGVDTQFFKPQYQLRPKDKKTILFVGQHLRDFATFNTVVKLLLEERKDIDVIVVLKKDYQDKILKHEKVSIFSDVSDEKLLYFYQSSHLLFIPFINVTACNSILEGLACGLPIITNKSLSTYEYLKNTKNRLISKESSSSSFKENIEALLEKDINLDISESSTSKAKEFDWRIIVSKLDDFYKKDFNL